MARIQISARVRGRERSTRGVTSMAILPICVESLLFTYIILIIDIQGTYALYFSLYLCGRASRGRAQTGL